MGSYADSSLTSGEKVVFETYVHGIIFFSFFALFTLFLGPILLRAGSEFVITNKRVICRHGILSRRTLEMQLNKVESVSVDQGLLGRMIGYGSVCITGSGGTKEHFHLIADPMGFRQAFSQAQA